MRPHTPLSWECTSYSIKHEGQVVVEFSGTLLGTLAKPRPIPEEFFFDPDEWDPLCELVEIYRLARRGNYVMITYETDDRAKLSSPRLIDVQIVKDTFFMNNPFGTSAAALQLRSELGMLSVPTVRLDSASYSLPEDMEQVEVFSAVSDPEWKFLAGKNAAQAVERINLERGSWRRFIFLWENRYDFLAIGLLVMFILAMITVPPIVDRLSGR